MQGGVFIGLWKWSRPMVLGHEINLVIHHCRSLYSNLCTHSPICICQSGWVTFLPSAVALNSITSYQSEQSACHHIEGAQSDQVAVTHIWQVGWMSHPPIPLNVSKGHLGQIQCTHIAKGHLGQIQYAYTHMAGWLDVPDPHPPLNVSKGHLGHLSAMYCSIWSDGETRDKGEWTSHRSCLSTASSLCWRIQRETWPEFSPFHGEGFSDSPPFPSKRTLSRFSVWWKA